MSTRNSTLHNYEYIAACSHIPTFPSRFSLAIRQQPVQTRQSTTSERDRRPVDPPPILQIKLVDATLRETQDFLQNPYFFMGASLVRAESSDKNNTCLSGLAGQTVSSMYKLKDYDNNDGGFFVFGDLSVRIEGRYRLRFTLFEITTQGAINLKSIYSDTFSVYSAKTFPGMLESTFLSRTFSDQGVRLRIRKEHRVQMAGSRKRKISTAQDDNDTVSSENSSVGRREKSSYNISPNATTSVAWYWPPSNSLSQQQQQRPPPPMVSIHLQQHHYYPHHPYVSNKVNISPPDYHPHISSSPPFSASSINKSSRRLTMDMTSLASFQNSFTRRSRSVSFHHNATLPLNDQKHTAEQYNGISITPQSGGIRLPPIRNIISTGDPNHNNKDIGEVDAAVAMIQLASSPQQQLSSQTTATTALTNTRAMVIHPSAHQHKHYYHHHYHSTTNPSSRKTQTKKSTVW
ncbi:hypothetical protein INT45_001129 [Circinella minor]|uniref:Velvet domain-containing protein n=1 Tax=Circinella minor TaxID=1195481 RepID=A0A8H7RYT9_9FUNG|nr:hypothetical protein INT45_001129 [Circinella minor]